MDPSELDRHFRTFQRQRDPAALAAVFDAAAPRLLLVAMHLVRDAATAEDLVQTVFLQVLRDADRCEPGRPVLPWLLGMVEHRAIDARRLAYRRRERAGPEVVGSAHGVADAAGTPPDLAADAEGRERVAEALAGMPRDYRDVLTLRLVHGLAAVDIAHSLGLSPATVRMRASRGLKLLRAALPRGLATPGLLAWLGAESLRARDGLQAVRATVLTAAGVGAGTTVGGSWLLGIAILLLCAVGTWSLAGSGEEAVAPAVAPLAAPLVADADPTAVSTARASNLADGTAALAAGRTAASDPRQTSFRGLVVDADSGAPLAGVEVGMTWDPVDADADAAPQLPAAVHTAVDGHFACSLVPPLDGILTIAFEAPGRLGHSITYEALRQGVEVDLGAIRLAAGTPVTVQLRRSGQPLAGVEVRLDGRSPDGASRYAGTRRSDAAGRIDLGTMKHGDYDYEVELPVPGRAGRFAVPLQAHPLEVAIDLGEPERAASITGVVLGPDGRPFAQVELHVPQVDQGRVDICVTDSEGRFVFARAEQSPPRVAIALVDRQRQLELVGEFADIPWGAHDLRLLVQPRATGTLRVRCVDAETGAPVTHYRATCWSDVDARACTGPSLWVAPSREHADGICMLEDLSPGAAFVSVFPPAPYAEFAERPVQIGVGAQELQVALRRPVACRVQAIDRTDGSGVAGVEILLARVLPPRHPTVSRFTYRRDLTGSRSRPGYSSNHNVLVVARGATDDDGMVTLSAPPDLPALVLIAEGPRCEETIQHDIQVGQAGATLAIQVTRAAELHGAVTPIDFVRRFGPTAEVLAEHAARARIERLDDDALANYQPQVVLRRVDDEQGDVSVPVRPDGSFRIGGVRAGRYEAWIDVEMRGFEQWHRQRLGPVATFTVTATAQPPTPPLLLDASRWLPGRLDLQVLVDGEPFTGVVELRSEQGRVAYRADHRGQVRSDWLTPGSYLVGVQFETTRFWPHASHDPRPVVLGAGAHGNAVASIDRRPVTITVQQPESGATAAGGCVVLRAPDQPLLPDDWQFAPIDADGVARFRAAPPGRLAVWLLTPEQVDARDLTKAVKLGELAADQKALHCTLPR